MPGDPSSCTGTSVVAAVLGDSSANIGGFLRAARRRSSSLDLSDDGGGGCPGTNARRAPDRLWKWFGNRLDNVKCWPRPQENNAIAFVAWWTSSSFSLSGSPSPSFFSFRTVPVSRSLCPGMCCIRFACIPCVTPACLFRMASWFVHESLPAMLLDMSHHCFEETSATKYGGMTTITNTYSEEFVFTHSGTSSFATAKEGNILSKRQAGTAPQTYSPPVP